jgi:hypothetical protein
MPFTYKAAGGGGGGAPDLSWNRFLIDDATKSDTQGLEGSYTEDVDSTAWTSIVSFAPSGDLLKPHYGCCYVKALADGNDTALTWDQNFTVEFLIEIVSAPADLKNSKLYFGFGVTDSSTDIHTGNSIGLASRWTSTSSSNYQSHIRFRRASIDNQGNESEDYDYYGLITHGPRYAGHGGNMHVQGYAFDPSNPTGAGDTGSGDFNISANKITGTGAVYGFVTCGLNQSISAAKTAEFRIWYKVSGGGNWTPGA